MWVALAIALLASIARADEASDFLAAWKRVNEQPDIAKAAWQEFAGKHAKHELGRVAEVLTGVAMLRDGEEPVKAAPFFELDGEAAGAIRMQLATTIKSMQARVKMAALAGKLKAYYAKHVEYPPALDALVEAKLAEPGDLLDPFGQRFAYEAKARKLAPDIPRQAYTLTCTKLELTDKEAASSLQGMTEPPKGITLSTTDVPAKQAYLKRQLPNGAIGPSQRIDAGQTLGDVTLWAVYDGWVLVGHQGVPKVLVKE